MVSEEGSLDTTHYRYDHRLVGTLVFYTIGTSGVQAGPTCGQ